MNEMRVLGEGAPVRDVTQRGSAHHNAFGFLRLVFASMVIFSHVPEVIDGSTAREFGQSILGKQTWGGLAVHGFFAISGYLITLSSLQSKSRLDFFVKRAARIFPGFIVSSLLCLTIVAKIGGAIQPPSIIHAGIGAMARMLLLARPAIYGGFPHGHVDHSTALNGALWTLQYEALCYVLVGLVVFLPRITRLPFVIGACSACLIAGAIVAHYRFTWATPEWLFVVGDFRGINVIAVFFSGSVYALVRKPVKAKPEIVVFALGLLLIGLRNETTIGTSFALFGTYIVLSLGEILSGGLLASINNTNDISYGTYLYGWPIEQILIHFGFVSSIIILTAMNILFALAMGYISWHLVEKPALAEVKRILRTPRPPRS